MKIKMYTKATIFPFEGMPYEKIMWVAYDSIDDINIEACGGIEHPAMCCQNENCKGCQNYKPMKQFKNNNDNIWEE